LQNLKLACFDSRVPRSALLQPCHLIRRFYFLILGPVLVVNSFVTIWIGGDTTGRHRHRKRDRVTTIPTRTARACTFTLTCRKRGSWEMRPSFRALDSRPRQSTTAIRRLLTSIPVRYSSASSELIVIGITDWRLLCPHSVVDSLDPILLSPVRPTYWRFGGPHRRGRSALRPRQQIDRHLARIAQFGRLVAPGSRPSAAHQKLVNTIFFFLSFRDPARDPLADFQWARAVWQPEEARYFYIFHL